MSLIDFWNFLTNHVFGVKESIVDISTELPCLGEHENPDRLSGRLQHVIESTGDCVLSNFEISSLIMFLRSGNCWHSYWATMFGDLKNSGHVPVLEFFEVTQTFVPWQKCSKLITNRAKRRVTVTRPMLYCQLHCHVTSCHVMSRHVSSCHVRSCHVTSRHVMAHHVTSCHVMSRHVSSCHVRSCHVTSRYGTSCHVMSRHATSCHVMPRQATSCHVISYHVMSRLIMPRHVTSCHVTSRHATSCHVLSRPVTSCHVGCPEACRYHTASAVYNPVLVSIHRSFSDNYTTDFCQIFKNCVFWCSLNNSVVSKLFWYHVAEINAKKQPKFAQNFKGWLRFLTITSKR